MNFHYRPLSTTKCRVRHSSASLDEHKLLSLSRNFSGDTVVCSVFWRLHLTTQVTFSHFSKDKLEIHEKTHAYLTDPTTEPWPPATGEHSRCTMPHNQLGGASPPNHRVEGSVGCHNPDPSTDQLQQPDMAHQQAGKKAEEQCSDRGHKRPRNHQAEEGAWSWSQHCERSTDDKTSSRQTPADLSPLPHVPRSWMWKRRYSLRCWEVLLCHTPASGICWSPFWINCIASLTTQSQRKKHK